MLEHLTWYARRLRAMSPREVAERAGRTLRHRADAASFHVARRAWHSRWQPAAETLLRGDPVQLPGGFLRPQRAAGLRDRFPEEADLLVARADALLEGRHRFFGYPEVVLGPERSDDVDPFTGLRWPRRHAKLLDYRRGAVGDPKWIWELNRCQDLPVLVAAWLVSGDGRHAQAASDRMASWIDGHPPGRGIAWSNGFEAGLRAISLAVTLDGLRGSEFLPPARREQALRSLWQHARWIERDPSTGSSANNHRIGELVGLVVSGCLVPELAAASRWLDQGLGALEREAEIQIRDDGTSVEQAFSYDVFVLDLLLVATAALDAAGKSVPPAIDAALDRSGDALWAQLGEDEPEPTYGDRDDGRALRLDGRDLRDGRGVAAAVAARLGNAKAARVASGLDAMAWWLFGETGADRFAGVEPAPQPGSRTLPDGGLTILRTGRSRAIFDHGPHGYLGIAAHAHADALRLDLSLGGAELVVDPGVGSYFARPKLRAAFRGTGFHATVLVDGADSSMSGGPFLWTRHASTRLLLADPDGGLAVAEHDGYERLGDPVTHRRAVAVLGEESIVVVDRLEGRQAHRFSQRWPLHPALELEQRSSELVVVHGEDVGLLLAFAASHPFVVRTIRGEEDPPAGWWSERLESAVPSWLVSADLEALAPVYFATLLSPFDGEAAPEARLELAIAADVARIEVTRRSGAQVLEVAFDPPTVALHDDLTAGVA